MKLIAAGLLTGLLLAVLLSYSNSFEVPLVFDDIGGIKNDQIIRDIDAEYLLNIPGRTRSLTQFSFALTYAAGGLDLNAHHAVSMVIHLLNTALVFVLAWQLLKLGAKEEEWQLGDWSISSHVLGALLAGVIFGLHPLQINGVTYLSQRLVSLATLFYVAALVCFVLWRTKDQRRWFWLAFVSTLLAMHSKEISFSIPLAMVAIELWFISPWKKQERLRDYGRRLKKPLIAMSLLLATLILVPLSLVGGVPIFQLTVDDIKREGAEAVGVHNVTGGWVGSYTRSEYFYTQLNVVRTYQQKILWPHGLRLDHDYPVSRTLFDTRTALSALLHIGLIGLGLWWYRRLPVVSFGILFFYGALAVTSSIVPLPELLFEYRVYLPLMGVAIAATGLLVAYAKRAEVAVALIAVVAVLGGWLTWERNEVWADEVRLWEYETRLTPTKGRTWNNLGIAYLRARELEKGLEAYRRQAEESPGNTSPYGNMGGVLGQLGRYDEALETLMKALELDPENDRAMNNIATVYHSQKNYPKAIEWFEKSLEVDPGDARVLINLADTYTLVGRGSEAILPYQKALLEQPDNVNWRFVLASLLVGQNRYAEAAEELETLFGYDENHGRAMAAMGEVQLQLENYNESISWFERAQNSDYGSTALVHAGLGKAHFELGNLDTAANEYRRAVYLAPNENIWWLALTEIYEQQGKLDAAATARREAR